MKIIVSGGGTGGHIYPAITLIEGIKKEDKDAQILYIGTNKGLEADIVRRAGIDFFAIEVEGLLRKFSIKNIFRLLEVCWATVKMLILLQKFKPNIVLGTGGYVSFPVLFAATILRVPTIIHEQNIVAGLSNKILAHFVTKVALGVLEARGDFPKENTVYTGNPIREEIILTTRKEAREFFHLSKEKKLLLIAGGSSGARSINRAMIEVTRYFAQRSDVEILHITGKNEYADVLERLHAVGIDRGEAKNIHVHPYLYEMSEAIAAADIIVSRAGAISIAEITAKALPSILIPYPYATANHQEKNARLLVERGAARMILDRELTGEVLKNTIVDILEDENCLAKMSEHAFQLANLEATNNIMHLIFSTAKSKA